MVSRNWFAGLVAAVLSLTVLVATVDPAAAVEPADADSMTAAAPTAPTESPEVLPDEPMFERPIDPLPTGDFSESFPVLVDDPADSQSPATIQLVSPDLSADGVVVARDQFSVTRRLDDGVFVRDISAVPVSSAGPDGRWVAIGTDFVADSTDSVSVVNNPLNPVVVDTATGSGVMSVSHGSQSLSTQLLGALDSEVSVEGVDGSDAAVFSGAVAHGDVQISSGLKWVKENVVLYATGTASTWAWRVSAKGLTLSLTADHEVVATDSGTSTWRETVGITSA